MARTDQFSRRKLPGGDPKNRFPDGQRTREPGRLAEQILQDMIADGHKPTSITLSILVKLYGRTSLEQALQVFADLPAQYDFTPNAQVFTCLMSVALTHRDVPEALRIKDRMQATGARPDSRCGPLRGGPVG